MTDGSPSTSPPLLPTLTRSDDQLREAFRKLDTATDVAHLLEVHPTQLTFAIWRKPEIARYRTWRIRKRNGGTREIDAPNKTHRILQQKMAHVLTLVAQRRNAAHGFVANRSIVTNARTHARSRWILNVDLTDFFPTIHFGRVRGMLMARPYQIGERAATAVAQLCCYKKRLPQGAPTSPIISNMICARLDGELRRLAESHGCKYTRYADDLTFSTNRAEFPAELATLQGEGTKATAGTSLDRIITTNGFQINPDKVRLQSRTTRQEVTGLIVNRRPNVRRAYVSQIRAMLHAWEKHGYEDAQSEFLAKYDNKHRPRNVSGRVFERVIRGKLAFLKQVRGGDDYRFRALQRKFAQLTGEIKLKHDSGPDMEFDVFISHASEDKSCVVEPLIKALRAADIRVWVDHEQINWGDSLIKTINSGLARSSFVIVVLSESFLKKRWPEAELDAVLTREIASGVTRALPLIVGDALAKARILDEYPLLRPKQYKEWLPSDVGVIVSALKAKLAQAAQSTPSKVDNSADATPLGGENGKDGSDRR